MKISSVEQALAEAMTVKLDANISTLVAEGIPIPTLDDLIARNTAGLPEDNLSPSELRRSAASKALMK